MVICGLMHWSPQVCLPGIWYPPNLLKVTFWTSKTFWEGVKTSTCMGISTFAGVLLANLLHRCSWLTCFFLICFGLPISVLMLMVNTSKSHLINLAFFLDSWLYSTTLLLVIWPWVTHVVPMKALLHLEVKDFSIIIFCSKYNNTFT